MVLVVVLWLIYQRINVFPLDDYLEYWASGRIILAGGNPYAADQMLRIEQPAGWPLDEALMMLNPPWVLPYTIFLGLFSHPLSRFITFLVQIAIVCWCAVNLWKIYGGNKEKEWITWLVVLTFGPILHAVKSGQITILVLLGCVGFLILIHKKMDFWAGVVASFVLVKPQLLYLFFVTLIIWSIARRRYQVLLSVTASIIVSMSITLIFNPSVISQYIVMVREYPLNLWMTSTLGASLRLLIGEEKYYLQFIPVIFGFLWLGWYLYKTRESFEWVNCLPLIILVSIVTTPYGWITDYAILVISVVPIAVLFASHGIPFGKVLVFSTYWAANLMVIFLSTSQNWFWWLPSFLLIWYLLSNRYLTSISARAVNKNLAASP